MNRTEQLLLALVVTLGGALSLPASPARAQFAYEPPGQLEGGDPGRRDYRIYAEGMRFPMQRGPAFLNSQIYNPGGYMGPPGGQCDRSNYSFPWHDNYCEARRWRMPLCPSSKGHQGQDIRPATCADNTHAVVATVDGRITNTGYSITLVGDDGTQYSYLHTSNQRVRVGQRVTCGTVLGYVSNLSSKGKPYTTFHLHFTIKQAMPGLGSVYVPTYMSLVDSYQRMESGGACGGAPVPGMDAGTPAPQTQAGCYSNTHGRQVENGQCVQVERGACGRDNCGVYQCVDGRWTCPVSTCSETIDHAACAEPTPVEPGSCRSYTLGEDVPSGTCVQVDRTGRPGEPADCADGCGWYECRDGEWNCTTEGACGAQTRPNAECSGPEPVGECRSSILGRNVPDGTCVQVDSRERAGEPASCADGCGWYRCSAGSWTCATSLAECGGEQHSNDACMADGVGCSSATLGETVSHGDCVQVTYQGCGMGECGWYLCSNGSWGCADVERCPGVTHENAECDSPDPCNDPSRSDCGSCAVEAGCAWCPGTGDCQDEATARTSCTGYRDSLSACEPCDFSDCTSCAESGYCSWCPGVGCVNDAVPDEVDRCGGDMISSPSGC